MIHDTSYTERQLLVSLLIEGIAKAEERLRRAPTREEVFEQLFPNARGDREALALSGMLNELVAELLGEWYEL